MIIHTELIAPIVKIKFKTFMLRSSMFYYSDAYIIVNGTTTITGEGADDAVNQVDVRYKGRIFKNSAPFTKLLSEINNTKVDDAQEIDLVMPMYNAIEYSDNCSKTSRSLWQCYRDEPNDI